MPRVINLRNEKPHNDAVRVDRNTKWGNPYIMGKDGDRDTVIKRYEEYMRGGNRYTEIKNELKGKDLVCWCSPLACHADFLLKIANE